MIVGRSAYLVVSTHDHEPGARRGQRPLTLILRNAKVPPPASMAAPPTANSATSVPPDVPPPPVLGAPLGSVVGVMLGTGATVVGGDVATAGVVVLGAGEGGALASADVLGAGAGGALPAAGALGLAWHVQDGAGAVGPCEGLAEHEQALAAWAVTLADAGTVVKVLQAAKLIAATPSPSPPPETAVLIFISGS